MYFVCAHFLPMLLALFATKISSEPILCYSPTDNCLKIDGKVKCYSPKKETIDSEQCLDWSRFANTSYMLKHGFEDFTGLNLTENYCGSNDGDYPWCHTNEFEDDNWNYCYDNYCYDCDEAFYYPKHTTLSGHSCEYWDDHGESFSNNYCLNPDDSMFGPWCYNTLGKRDYCYKVCETKAVDPIESEDICTGAFDSKSQCYDSIENCSTNANQFFGCLDPRTHTLAGEVCEYWTSSNLQAWQSTFVRKFPAAILKENQCDTPDGDERPWCFVGNSWQYCYENCADCRMGYFPRSQTVHGNECDAWANHTGNTRLPTGTEFPARVGENGCYNPDNNPGGPWCFSAAENGGWGYCFDVCPIKCSVPTLETGVKLYQHSLDGNADYRKNGENIGIGAYNIEYSCPGQKIINAVNCENNGNLSNYSTFSDICS